MAAHKLTGLRQTEQDAQKIIQHADDAMTPESFLGMMSAALDFSTWTEDLAVDEWAQLRKYVDAQNIPQIAIYCNSLIPAAEKEWGSLGQPSCREQWCERRHQMWLEQRAKEEQECLVSEASST